MTVEQLYQSRQHTCSGNDAELIAFNPDAADNTRVCSLTQRAQSMRRERERENTLIKRKQGMKREVSKTTIKGKGKHSKRCLKREGRTK